MGTAIKPGPVPTAARILSGPQASSVSLPNGDSRIRPSAARPAAKGVNASASAELLRAADLLREVLLRDDESEEVALLGQVSAGVNEIVDRLQALAGLQMMFEGWSAP